MQPSMMGARRTQLPHVDSLPGQLQPLFGVGSGLLAIRPPYHTPYLRTQPLRPWPDIN